MGRTACAEPQCLYNGVLYLFFLLLYVASKEIGLRNKWRDNQYTFTSPAQNHNTKTGNKSFETVEPRQYLRTTLKNQNSIHEQIHSRLYLGHICCHSVQNLLPSSLLSKHYRDYCTGNYNYACCLAWV